MKSFNRKILCFIATVFGTTALFANSQAYREYDLKISRAGLYDINIDIPFKDFNFKGTQNVKDQGRAYWWTIDRDNSKIMQHAPLTVSVEKDAEHTLIGTVYLLPGIHRIRIERSIDNNGKQHPMHELLVSANIKIEQADIYFSPRLKSAAVWWNKLLRRDKNNNIIGWTESASADSGPGYDQYPYIWTHCNYFPEKIIYSNIFNNNTEIEYALEAGNFMYNKMMQKIDNDRVRFHTVYKYTTKEFEKSIEKDMEQGKYDLWRGCTAGIEESLNLYLVSYNKEYLDYAKKCADYIIAKWPGREYFGCSNIYTRLSDGAENACFWTESIGRYVMVMCQLYTITGNEKYLNNAVQQGKALLACQDKNTGLFYSGLLNNNKGWQHVTAYANAMFGLAWLYKTTKNSEYKNAILLAVNKYSESFDPQNGSPIGIINNDWGMLAYGAGRIAQALFTCAHFLENDPGLTNTEKTNLYRIAEKNLYFIFGFNKEYEDMQITDKNNYYRGGYAYSYHHKLKKDPKSNSETSGEINLGTVQLYYLNNFWNK